MKTTPSFIHTSGLMTLHAKEGGVAVFDFYEANGSTRDVSADPMFFEVPGFRKQLSLGEASNQLVLTIEPGDLAGFLRKVTEYIILDESGDVPRVILEGKLIVRGWE